MGSLAGIQLRHGVASLPCLAPRWGRLGGRLSWTGDRVPAGGSLAGTGPLTEAQGSWQVFQRQEIEAVVSQGGGLGTLCGSPRDSRAGDPRATRDPPPTRVHVADVGPDRGWEFVARGPHPRRCKFPGRSGL